ncbi:GspH/FimT family pseudopilin [Craterilacuibacter sp. RT1T]|uniref:GspH/FimT family pseudopilin n=1 Tax=Craterilacuibacter sp. RT1T TaxID=2942211 RepID=UPI0020BEC7BD|nr:GspH/FimT family pseudopilin [Craterilacuibacter sp. RT1T]MCL6264292.1 GspH/FimT family pseudopilin [Craterilacuibacter sp. RT1T]
MAAANIGRERGKEGGVTLVELVIVMSLLAIMAAVAVPNMNQFLRDARLSSQTDLLASSLQLARTEAINRRVNITVCPLANPNADNACSADAADWARGWGVLAGANILQRVTANPAVTIAPDVIAGAMPVVVVFNPTQGNATQDVSLRLCAAGSQQRTVRVSLSGRIGRQIGPAACP